MTTPERLAQALAEAGAAAELVQQAKVGAFDDFLSPSIHPKHELVKAATDAGLHGIVERVLRGEFDATEDEARAWLEATFGSGAIP